MVPNQITKNNELDLDSKDRKKKCLECAYDIPYESKKCKECGSFQDWRRYLTFSSITISLMIALITVTTLSIQIIVDAFKPKDAIVKLFVTRAEIVPMNEKLFKTLSGLVYIEDKVGFDIEEPIIRFEFVAVNNGSKTGLIRLVTVDMSRHNLDDRFIGKPLLISDKNNSPMSAIPVKPGDSIFFNGYRPVMRFNMEPMIGYSVMLSNGKFDYQESRQNIWWDDLSANFERDAHNKANAADTKNLAAD